MYIYIYIYIYIYDKISEIHISKSIIKSRDYEELLGIKIMYVYISVYCVYIYISVYLM